MMFRRSPHGERGLKLLRELDQRNSLCRSPHGERGLKFYGVVVFAIQFKSLPSRGAWIEISSCNISRRTDRVAPLTGSVD